MTSNLRILSVSEFIDNINKFLTGQQVIIKGEIGEKINQYPNYIFFTLLDQDKSLLKCFMWRNILEDMSMLLVPGVEVMVEGYAEVRKNRGELTFQVKRISFVGEGALKKKFELLKRELAAQGYFDKEHKKIVSPFVRRIGLITSKSARGAFNDFMKNLGNYGFEIYFYDVKVEGFSALGEIIKAIEWFNKSNLMIEVIVIIRGGGDWESLEPFNTKEIVQAIFSSRIPVVTGIGHEDDKTLADYVADVYTSTPTAAARFLRAHWDSLEDRLNFFRDFFVNAFQEKLRYFIKAIHYQQANLSKLGMTQYKNKLKHQKDFFIYSFAGLLKRIKDKLAQLTQIINVSNPKLQLRRGYSISKDMSGKIIKNSSLLMKNQVIKSIFYKGEALSMVRKIINNNEKEKI